MITIGRTIPKQTVTKKINRIVNQTTESMKELGVYKKEFDTTIRRYANIRLQYDLLNEEWYENGCHVTEKYTNKNGSTNNRKTALYLSIESLRKELLDIENTLGLTPKGLKQIQASGLKEKKKSALDKVLMNV